MSTESETRPELIEAADLCLPAADLKTEMPFFIDKLGFRLDMILPADNPAVALVSGHGLRLRLDRNAKQGPATLQLNCRDARAFAGGETTLTSPNGNRVEIVDAHPPLVIPKAEHAFMVSRMADAEAWGIGRAGMNYRDLIPGRLGGAIIASHIRIPGGGPVPDMVHYHTIGFQLIFCVSGWVRVLYEDQGDLMTLEAGDCVIQPPEIRHRVMEASPEMGVLEVGVPAEHITTIDHEMTLPNGTNPDREWQGTRFVHYRAAEAAWSLSRLPGWLASDSGIGEGTQGIAGVTVLRPGNDAPQWASHDCDVHFTFVRQGGMTLEVEGESAATLETGDSFVLPPNRKARYAQPSNDCELIEVSLPAAFATTLHGNSG
jgi:quercetin dioxygenase-like cupin family protein